jgi:glutathione peroxidase
MRMTALLTACVLVVSAASAQAQGEKKMSVHELKMKSIDGKDVDLSQYKGKVLLIVNVASECGYTPHYKGMQELYEKYAKDGLVVIGVPANDFGKQEPGSNEEIKQFCESKYKVTFPMMAKVAAKGTGIAPIFQTLTTTETPAAKAGDIRWNFEKFLIGKDGQLIARWGSGTEPMSNDIQEAVKKALK